MLWRPWWLRWLPIPSRFAFRTEITAVTDGGWEVRDTTTFPNGKVQMRRMRCTPVGDGRLHLAGDDLPGGAEVTPRRDGFDFAPYAIRTPVIGPLDVLLCFTDTVHLDADQTMVDEIVMRYRGVRVGIVTIRLRRTDRAPESVT